MTQKSPCVLNRILSVWHGIVLCWKNFNHNNMSCRHCCTKRYRSRYFFWTEIPCWCIWCTLDTANAYTTCDRSAFWTPRYGKKVQTAQSTYKPEMHEMHCKPQVQWPVHTRRAVNYPSAPTSALWNYSAHCQRSNRCSVPVQFALSEHSIVHNASALVSKFTMYKYGANVSTVTVWTMSALTGPLSL